MDTIRITCPNRPDEYVEIRSTSGPIERAWEEVGSLFRLHAREFDEVIVARGKTVLRLRCDKRIPGHVPPAPGFDTAARLNADVKKKDLNKLVMDYGVELQLHLSTPLAPLDCGVWVRLMLEGEHGLAWVSNSHNYGCSLLLADQDPNDEDDEFSAPPWFQDPHARWTVAIRGKPALGSTLLSCVPGRNELGNLVHLDPERKAGAGDAGLSLYLEPAEDGTYEVCTELALSPRFATRAPVSGYALRVHAETRASAPFVAQGVLLQCAQYEARNGWTLHWLDVPGAQAAVHADALSLESLTQALLDQHSPGLATVRARNRLSFVPAWIDTADPQAKVTLRFEVEAEKQRPLKTRLERILLTAPARNLRLHCAGALDQQRSLLRLGVRAEDAPADSIERFDDCLVLARWNLFPTGVAAPAELGVGSVLLSLGELDSGTVQLGVSTANADYRRAALVSSLQLKFRGARYTALSMDPELGFETLSADTARERPWTFDLLREQACDLQIVERATQAQSRLLSIQLKLPEAGGRETDVVLVDPSPMTVVRLKTREVQGGGEILAEYIDDADQAAEWRFYSFEGKMTAILPPQGIGEEMVKGNLHLQRGGARVRVPAEGELFDFRLTPVARLVLDRTDINMARSEAPWSLRRLLSRRLGTTGLKLERADFELLYGLSARLEAPGLRVAELDGFIGRIPYGEELRRARRMEPNSVKGVQGRKAADWIAALWQRPSWWRVYAELADRSRLALDQGIEYRLRPTRQTAHPFEIGRHATQQGAADRREPLRGGVDWPFQSRNIYEELEPAQPTVSSGGSIEGLVFGSLGGEGAQTAAFNNGKTLVITNSRQGRIDSLTLIRVGRIAMLWNKARHVIVYERTTRRPKRYEEDPGWDPDLDDLEVQPPFEGLAALRKVREYVEITEPRRAYPDTRADRPISGPLTQSVFNSTVIPVRSDWGRDIRQGFAIALRGPIPPKKEDFFPDPQVFLDFARASAKAEGNIGQRILNTQQLVFFTSTRKEDGGNTDLWPAWPEIDFPLVRPAPPPQLPFSTSFRGRSRQPDAAPVELGMAPFTFTLAPAEEAANLMHARPVKGLESKIFNINLARGLPAAPPAITSPAQQAALAATAGLSEVQALLVDGLSELRTELAARLQNGDDGALAEHPQLKEDVARLLARLRNSVKDAPIPAAPQGGRTWLELQQAQLAAYTDGVKAEAERLKTQLLQQALDLDLERARGNASAIVDAVCKQAQQRIAEVGFIPHQALDAVRNGLQSATRRLTGELDSVLADAIQLLADLQRRYEKDPDSAATLDLLWREAIEQLPARLRVLLDRLRKVLDGELATWFSRLKNGSTDTVYDKAESQLAQRLEAVADWLARWVDAIPPFDLEPPAFAELRSTLADVLSPALVQDALKDAFKWLAESLAKVENWAQLLDTQVGQLKKWEQALARRIAGAAKVEDLRALLDGAARDLQGNLADAAGPIANAIEDKFKDLHFLDVQGALDGLKDFQSETTARLDAIEKALAGNLAELEQAAREQALEIEKRLQAAGRQAEDWVSRELGPAYQIGKENIAGGLEALRILAEGPVTDAMRTTRERIGYYFYQSEAGVMLTRASAVFNELSGDVLNALNVDMPFDRLTDRLKACVGGMMARDLFPSLAGIDMTYLLPDLNVPLEGDEQYEWLRLQHGFDKDRLRAWAKVTIDKRFETDATLFDLGPVKLRLLKPLFAGTSDITIEKDGRRTQKTTARLNADFEMSLNDRPMVTLRDGTLSFDESGHLDFDVDANRIELAPELQFITEAISKWQPQIEGFTLVPLLPGGVSSSLSLPLPDIGTGAFTLTGITLNTHLDLRIADGFEISTGLWLSKPDRPFGLAVLFLGGGGWFGIDATYRPPARFLTRVSVGISAGAFIALNFGFAAGSAGILFTASVDFYRDWQAGAGSTAISLGILVWGEFSVLGIASASMRLVMRVTYEGNGSMRGTGQFSVKIKICWCYTLRVNRSVQKQFAGSSSGGGRSLQRAAPLLQRAGAVHARAIAAVGLDAAPHYAELPDRADPEAAVADYLKTLAIVTAP